MATLNRKWSLKAATNLKELVQAIKVTPEYSAKLLGIAEGVKSGSLKYEEEFIVDQKANTARLIVYLNGEIVRDHGVVKGDEEIDHTSDDGRPTKLKVVIESNAKFTATEKGADFTLVSVVEAVGDTLTVSNDGNGTKSVWTFVASS